MNKDIDAFENYMRNNFSEPKTENEYKTFYQFKEMFLLGIEHARKEDAELLRELVGPIKVFRSEYSSDDYDSSDIAEHFHMRIGKVLSKHAERLKELK